MKPPVNAKTFEAELATFWFDEAGILYARGKNTARTLEIQQQFCNQIRQLSGNNKVCLLIETTHLRPHNKEIRDYTASQLGDIFKAIATISTSTEGILTVNVFKAIKNEPVPIRIFENENDAKEWLMTYL